MGRGKGKGKGEGRGGDVLGLSMERKNVVLPRPPFQALCPRHTQTKHEHHQPTCMCTLCLTVCTHRYIDIALAQTHPHNVIYYHYHTELCQQAS